LSFSGVWANDPVHWAPSVKKALQRLTYHRENGVEIATEGDVTLGVTNNASLYTSGPSNSLVVVFNGAIFERPALVSRLDASQHLPGLTNAHLLALAYQKWGESLVDDVDGEFAFVVWDGRLRKLILGRDAMGRQSLYYGMAGEAVIVASEPEGMFAFPGMRPEPDDTTVVRIMSTRYESGCTIFRGIRYPPPARHVVIERGKPHRLVRFWRPEEQPLLRLRDPREYAEALHAALLCAVEVRLPSEGTVASQLSSGYDSSAVTALVAQALARKNRSLLAYTSVPTHATDASAVMPGAFPDEWPLASKVASMYANIEHIRVPTGGASWMEAIDAMTQLLTGPPSFIRNTAWIWDLHRRAHARGANVMFNGSAGNLTSSYDGSFSLFDLRRRHDWSGLARAIAWRRRKGTSWKGLFFRTWMPSASVRSTVRRLRGKSARSFYADCLIRPDFYRATGVPELTESPIGQTAEGDRRNSAAWRLSLMHLLDFGGMDAADQRMYGMRRADPTADRRVVELCMSIPDEAYIMGTAPRQLYREAMKDMLPAELLQAKGGGLQSSDFLENFRDGLGEFRAEMELLKASPSAGRVLDLARMEAMLESFPADLNVNRGELDLRYNYTFGGAIAMGRFLRKMENGELDWAAATA
jgi:asparagine synthase (glutamine-hydrolysing)